MLPRCTTTDTLGDLGKADQNLEWESISDGWKGMQLCGVLSRLNGKAPSKEFCKTCTFVSRTAEGAAVLLWKTCTEGRRFQIGSTAFPAKGFQVGKDVENLGHRPWRSAGLSRQI